MGGASGSGIIYTTDGELGLIKWGRSAGEPLSAWGVLNICTIWLRGLALGSKLTSNSCRVEEGDIFWVARNDGEEVNGVWVHFKEDIFDIQMVLAQPW